MRNEQRRLSDTDIHGDSECGRDPEIMLPQDMFQRADASIGGICGWRCSCPADAAWPAWEEVTDILKQRQAQDAARHAIHMVRDVEDPKGVHADSAHDCRQVPVSEASATEVLAESTAGKAPAACLLRSRTKQRASRSIRRRWSAAEEERFLKALEHFEKTITIATVDGRLSVKLGPSVAEIMSLMIKTRSTEQVRSHVQKHYIRLEREASRCRVVT